MLFDFVNRLIYWEKHWRSRVQAVQSDKIPILMGKKMKFTSFLIRIDITSKICCYYMLQLLESSISKHMIKILCCASSIFSSPCVELDWCSCFKLNKKEWTQSPCVVSIFIWHFRIFSSISDSFRFHLVFTIWMLRIRCYCNFAVAVAFTFCACVCVCVVHAFLIDSWDFITSCKHELDTTFFSVLSI